MIRIMNLNPKFYFVVMIYLLLFSPLVHGRDRESARKELEEKNIVYNSIEFTNRIKKGDVETVKLFLEAGMDLNIKEKPECTDCACNSLALAAEHGRNKIVQLLLDAGADINDNSCGGSPPPLFMAAEGGHPSTVQLLLKRGAGGVNELTRGGETLLVWAAKGNDIASIKTLLNRGADINKVDANGQTALTIAAKNGNAILVRLLIKGGADVNLRRPILLAVQAGHDEIVMLLKEAGAHANF